MTLEYPCVMLNADVDAKFTNHQYQELVDPKRGKFETRSECSIFFEVDGPYKCMVLPASTEEGKFLKKRYAVFNFDGSLAELKGFELKRRGELELIKTFQSEVFERFLEGEDLKECYDAVAEVANYWIDVLDTRGETLDDDELVGLISENRSMSRQLEDYGGQKGTSQTTARRLGEFLGKEFIKDKGLNCKFIIAEQPFGAPVTERAIPVAIWKAEPSVMKHFLRKWLKSPGLDDDALDIRNVLDWDYYLDRLGNTIRKIITIPAALQRVNNPVPRVGHPAWLSSKINKREDKRKQQSITSLFKKAEVASVGDMEDIGQSNARGTKRPIVHRSRIVNIQKDDDENVNAALDSSAGDGDPQHRHDMQRVHLSNETFPDWLKQKKEHWRKARRNRRVALATDKKPRTNVSVEGFVRDAARTLRESEWHVLEIREMAGYGGGASVSGEFTLWALLNNSSLQKVNISIPRTVFLSARASLCTTDEIFLDFKQVERILPEGQVPPYLYEITIPEHTYRTKNWLSLIKPRDDTKQMEDVVDKLYESGTPLNLRALSELGSVVQLKTSSRGRSYELTDFARVSKPSSGEYLHHTLSYKRIFLYVRMHPSRKSGIIAAYVMNGGSGNFGMKKNSDGQDIPTDLDLTRPSDKGEDSFDVGGVCRVWIVKPNTNKAQRNLTAKMCQSLYTDVIQQIKTNASPESEYASIAASSSVKIEQVDFIKTEEAALASANEFIANASRSGGATMLLVNSSKPIASLRRVITATSSLPTVEMPFPPGRFHDPFSLSALPPLNWEQPATRLFLEAYIYLMVVSFPKKVSYARYGQIPLGSISTDENFSLYEVSMNRMLKQNRGLSWASAVLGKPDAGVNVRSRVKDGLFCNESGPTQGFSQDEIWSDEKELLSPVVRKPGTYRAICVDLDVQDLAIAALTSAMNSDIRSTAENMNDHGSPTSVAFMNPLYSHKSAPLGDEMATTFSLSMLKALTTSWIRDVFNANSFVADEALHHIYRLVSSPESLYHDPALHRVLHSLMKTTFMKLLGELQRLGCCIVYACFQRITVATNKVCLADAEEHVDFLIKTIQGSANNDQNEALSRVTLRPRLFHSHFIFLDEYNFGTLQLERHEKGDVGDHFGMPDPSHPDAIVVPAVVTAWSLKEFLDNSVAQEYFQAIMGRFSMEPFKKQAELLPRDGLLLAGAGEAHTQLLEFKAEMIAGQFAQYLTRAVGEILQDGADDPERSLKHALAFIKSVLAALELDQDIEDQVQALKRSLLSQVGVAEYSVTWENPCPIFMLPDVFCEECSESRDVNLCFTPPGQEDMDSTLWICEDCHTPYNSHTIEQRLIHILNRQVVRYQLQDLRCAKTNRIPSRSLVALSECAAPLQTDISRESVEAKLRLLWDMAQSHELESLRDLAEEVLTSYRGH